jgi:hypothetical protein
MHRTALIILAPIVVATLGELAAATRDEDPKSIISAQTPQSAIQDMQPQSPTRMCGCCNARTQATGFASLRIWPPRSNASTRASTATSECRQTQRTHSLASAQRSTSAFADGDDKPLTGASTAGKIR